ncbi:MAG: 4-hydroxythreonine-4-phosphate dehydrogenase PdxA [Luteitalea sp.]|nr:4-hydroxythreonine-4-phosphate dehydrogenase PdxA [Luteitalea sp.]
MPDAQAQERPIIAVTLGDPAGIGPEVVLKALADPETRSLATWVIVGDRDICDRAQREAGIPLESMDSVSVRHVDALNGHAVVPGRLDAACGRAAVAYVREATDLCLRGDAVAMVTAPLNKEAVALSGLAFSGHTEYIAARCGAPDSRMMLTHPRLSVVHVTTHAALRDACNASSDRIARTISLGHQAMQWLGLSRPRIAVCGLNPHASEHGLFGCEEATAIRPAVEAARAAGLSCEGPFAADTICLDAWRGQWDLVVAMYHDQGHIPMKLLDFAHTVNMTLGIPIVRTSVDHGTAFDIAGRNVADSTNMMAALRLAARIRPHRAASPAAAPHTKGLRA